MGSKVMWVRARFLAVGLLLPLAGSMGWVADGVEVALDDDVAVTTITMAGSDTVVRLWDSVSPTGVHIPQYSISLDGQTVNVQRDVAPTIRLKYASFDPLAFEPDIPQALRADQDNRLYLVQFQTQSIKAYRDALTEMGASLIKFVADQAFIVEMDSETVGEVEQLPFVRWVGAMQPAYKIDPGLIPDLFPADYANAAGAEGAAQANLDAANVNAAAVDHGNDVVEYSIMMTRRGPLPQASVANRITAMGGNVLQTIPEGFRIRALLTPVQLAQVLQMNDVLYVDLQGVQEDDMDIARQIGGADYLRDTIGILGQGVRAEVMDGGVRATHQQFEGEVIVHAQNSGSASHGTSTYGIVFASGTGNAQATGMLPEAEAKIFCDYDLVINQSTNRYNLTSELVDPNGPYRGVFQSNSWGNTRTFNYTTISAEMDDILFLNDLVVCQSQSNAGNQDSRPQAWAKNIVSVGGVYHHNTLDKADDNWGHGGSIGPATDGRIKPDLTHFYDQIFTTSSSSDTSYTTSFGGTSGATPITAGHFGLMFQMWHESVFPGFGGGNSVFDDKPGMATAKALMINSADPYSGGDFTRYTQGWGMADLRYLYDNAGRLLVVDQSDRLTELQSNSYEVEVSPGSPELKVTMVFPDPMGDPNAQVARINDLSLKVTAPDNTVYWGNNGLTSNDYSTPGGSANTIDTVENVYVESPMGGTWTIEVIASEINEDGDLGTPEVDANYGLVASGIGAIPMRLQASNWVSGVRCDAEVFAATPGSQVAFIYSLSGTGSTYIPQLDVTIDLASPGLAGTRVADQGGYALLRMRIPNGLSGRDVWMQAAQFQRKSNVIHQVVQ